jgi:hypothetical protein
MSNLHAFLKMAFEVFYLNKKRHDAFVKELLDRGFVIDEYTGKRMTAGTSIAAITNLWFSSLRGFPSNAEEKRCGLLVGALTPIYDDLLDVHGFTSLAEKSFDQILAEESMYHGMNNNLNDLFFWLMKQAYEKIILKDEYRRFFQQTIVSQKESLRQMDGSELDQMELKKIMMIKGGNATLLYRHLLGNKMKEGEEQLVFATGGLMQFANDIFDTWNDHKSGNRTLATISTNPFDLKEAYFKLLREVVKRAVELPYPQKNILSFLRFLLPVIARALVCFDQFERLFTTYGHFDIPSFSRQQMICDMEKPVNMIANVRYAAKLFDEEAKPLIKNNRAHGFS